MTVKLGFQQVALVIIVVDVAVSESDLARLKCGAILNTRRNLPELEWNGPVSYAKLAHSILVKRLTWFSPDEDVKMCLVKGKDETSH
uniref:Uncharacterized protein n=1 Tax=Timema poppense TaxID=170557 RepID=A0A7R9H391_TIMPO|nr:unnamed protein product [Timema poppensis]